ncbi:hypothetical protein JAAARDRAFT_605793 [Jaapia argillacea MUCL 33604]|uniref:Uncharacterized protein n=1 Tax=Jaapia argillacea MUCL 33604 TaxID=933084 RepID=A0A067QAB0_9AGAM|nr:hypothetical protein JAAARDRAFT_605793 [Jaapia argillacea MUCL 33604]
MGRFTRTPVLLSPLDCQVSIDQPVNILPGPKPGFCCGVGPFFPSQSTCTIDKYLLIIIKDSPRWKLEIEIEKATIFWSRCYIAPYLAPGEIFGAWLSGKGFVNVGPCRAASKAVAEFHEYMIAVQGRHHRCVMRSQHGAVRLQTCLFSVLSTPQRSHQQRI